MEFSQIEYPASVCCGVSSKYPELGICPECGEHTDFLTDAEYEEWEKENEPANSKDET